MDKKMLVVLGLSLATFWLFNIYFSKKTQPEQAGVVTVGQQQDTAVTPGQPFKVITSQELARPLDLAVDFAQQPSTPEQTVTIQTNYCTAELSTYGATLINLAFKEHTGKAGEPLQTISPLAPSDKDLQERGSFLLALDQKTPYAYTFVSKNETKNTIDVLFSAENEFWTIYKTYNFHKDSYQIDLALRFEPKTPAATPLRPRIFFSAPHVAEKAPQDKMSQMAAARMSFAFNDSGTTLFTWNESKQNIDKIEVAGSQGLAWFWTKDKPLFGAEDRYFVHALIDDSSRFVRRAYVKQYGNNTASVLEGPTLSAGKNEWKLSFYMGPKLFDHLHAVDDRLEDIMSFGWLSWICKMLLKLLSWINDYVGNFGLAIIVMAFALKLPLMPLSIYAGKQREIYQHYLPSINKIRTKYRHDLQMQQQELMLFFKEHNISPSSNVVGCLPFLIQMPVLFALYRALNNYLDLYQAPFFGWIHDLSDKDPFYVVPILMGLSMLWQQSITPTTDGKQRVIMFFMSLVTTVVFANFPVGLVLYWFTNNIISIGEDYLRRYFFS